MIKNVAELREELRFLIHPEDTDAARVIKHNLSEGHDSARLSQAWLEMTKNVLFTLAVHNSDEAVAAIRDTFSSTVLAFRLVALDALSRMTVPSAEKAIRQRLSFWRFANREEKVAAKAIIDVRMAQTASGALPESLDELAATIQRLGSSGNLVEGAMLTLVKAQATALAHLPKVTGTADEKRKLLESTKQTIQTAAAALGENHQGIRILRKMFALVEKTVV